MKIMKARGIHTFCKRTIVTLVVTVFLVACSTAGGPVSSAQKLSSDPLIGKFVWHDLITDDIDVARNFYSGLFGWKFEDSTRPGSGQPYVLIQSDGYFIAGMLELEDPENDDDFSRWLGYMSVENVDASTKATSVAGGKVVVTPRNLGKVARVAAIEDPQGAVLGLVRSELGDPLDGIAKKPGHIVWNELLASDATHAGAFYASLAGYEINRVNRRGGEYTMLRSAGMKRAGILQRPADNIKPVWITYFAVGDPVASAKLAEQLGGKILLSPSEEFREGTVALITDPTGAVLALQKWPL